MQILKAVHHILVSSADTIGAFNTDFDTVNLHRPTLTIAEPTRLTSSPGGLRHANATVAVPSSAGSDARSEALKSMV